MPQNNKTKKKNETKVDIKPIVNDKKEDDDTKKKEDEVKQPEKVVDSGSAFVLFHFNIYRKNYVSRNDCSWSFQFIRNR